MDPDELKKLLEMAEGVLASAERLRPGQNRATALQLIRDFVSKISFHLDRREFGDDLTLPCPSAQDLMAADNAAADADNI